jgi:hypothetical protein
MRRCHDAVKTAPPEIVLYAVFSVVVCIADQWLTYVGPKVVREQIVPFTGWGASMPYLFGLFFTISLIFGRDRRPALRVAIISFLAIYIVFGVGKPLSPQQNNFGNPYLTVSSWQPIWTLAVPSLWIVALLVMPAFRSMKRKGSPA